MIDKIQELFHAWYIQWEDGQTPDWIVGCAAVVFFFMILSVLALPEDIKEITAIHSFSVLYSLSIMALVVVFFVTTLPDYLPAVVKEGITGITYCTVIAGAVTAVLTALYVIGIGVLWVITPIATVIGIGVGYSYLVRHRGS